MRLSALFVLCVCAFAGTFASSASAEKSASGRADVPWVSLAHQREISRKNAEKTAAGDSQQAGQSSGAKSSEKTEAKSGGTVAEKSASKSASDGGAKSGLNMVRPELTADKFDYAADESGTLTARGNAKLASKEFELLADKITYSQKLNSARVMDDVRVSTDKYRVITNAADVSLDGKRMITDYARFGTVPLFLESDHVVGAGDKYELYGTKVYFGEPASGAISATSSKTSFDNSTRKIKMEDVVFRIDALPVAAFKSMEIDADSGFPFTIRNRTSYNADYGVAIQNTVYYTGFETFDPGVLLDVYTKRSVLFGPALDYETQNSAHNRMRGSFQGGYIYDTGDRSVLGTDSLGRKIERDRYFIELRHNQIYDDRFGLTANVSAWSDQYSTRDFREDFFYDNQAPDNFAEAIYYGDMWTASLFTRFAPNNWQLVQQRLPEARIDVQPVEVFSTGAYLRGFVSAEYLRQYNPDPTYYFEYPAESFESARFDGYVGVDRPIQLSEWAKITPVAGARLTSFFDTATGGSNYTRALGQVGFDAQMDVWGQFDYSSRTMNIDGLRHHITPLIQYRYIPAADQGSSRIRRIDGAYYTTYPPILDLGAMRNVDEMAELNTMRFGIQNVFETRDAEFGSRELARLDIFQDVNFTRRQPALKQVYWDGTEREQEFSELFIHASVSPARWLTAGTYTRVSVENSCAPEINTYLKLIETDIASFTIGTVYLRDNLEQYYAAAEYKISERYQVFGSWHYDAEISAFVNQRYGLRTKIGNTWIIEYFFGYRKGAAREDSTSFGVNVVILGL